LREERKQELEEHVEAVNALLKDVNGAGVEEEEDDEWGGIEDKEPAMEAVDHEEEYIDEDRYTTVTVEAVDVSKEGLMKVREDDSDNEIPEEDAKPVGKESSRKVWPKKPKKNKFRYESKAERKITRVKQKAGNKARADARRGNG
jgi:ribosomal RNA-processing protein 17